MTKDQHILLIKIGNSFQEKLVGLVAEHVAQLPKELEEDAIDYLQDRFHNVIYDADMSTEIAKARNDLKEMNKFKLSEIDPKRFHLAELLADFTDDRTKEQKAIAAGFTPKYVYQLEREPAMADLIYKLLRRNIAVNLPHVYNRLEKQTRFVDKDAMPGIRTYLQAAGEIQSGANVTTTVVQSTDGRSFGDRITEATQFKRERATDTRRITEEDLD